MPASTQQQFNSAVKLSESMLRSLKRNDGLQGPLKAQLFEGTDPVGVTSTFVFSTRALACSQRVADCSPELPGADP